jgi:hypothetical protein
MARGYQNTHKKQVRNYNKFLTKYYRHFDIVQTFRYENNYSRELTAEFDKLTHYLLFSENAAGCF